MVTKQHGCASPVPKAPHCPTIVGLLAPGRRPTGRLATAKGFVCINMLLKVSGLLVLCQERCLSEITVKPRAAAERSANGELVWQSKLWRNVLTNSNPQWVDLQPALPSLCDLGHCQARRCTATAQCTSVASKLLSRGPESWTWHAPAALCCASGSKLLHRAAVNASDELFSRLHARSHALAPAHNTGQRTKYMAVIR